MPDGVEVFVWLAVIGFIGIRSAMQRSRAQARSQAEPEREPDHLPPPDHRPPMERASPAPRGRPRSTADSAGMVARMSRADDEPVRSPPARRGSGVLSRLSEFAADIERQMKEQQEQQEQARRLAAGQGAGETVFVPGRRVSPRQGSASAAADPEQESHWNDWESQPESLRLHPAGRQVAHPSAPQASERESGPARTRRSGLARLEAYGTLERAIILAEVLGPAPGLHGASPAERRLDELG
ncbi:MAG: hypothetical protein ACC682_09520 [Gemmatimonadota bacterium]